MLLPKRVKYRRVQRGRMTGKATRGNVVCQGQYGLVALEPAWISSTQIEAARVAMTRYIKRGGKVWIKIFPDKPVTDVYKRQAENQFLALLRCSVTNTVNFQDFLIAFCYTMNHVVN